MKLQITEWVIERFSEKKVEYNFISLFVVSLIYSFKAALGKEKIIKFSLHSATLSRYKKEDYH